MRRRRYSLTFVVLWVTLLVAGRAHGQALDGEVDSTITDIMDGAGAAGDFTVAVEQLEATGALCEGGGCSSKMKAKLSVAIATAHARSGNEARAKKTFERALREDPGATLIAKYVNGDVRAAFLAVQTKKDKAASEGCRGSYSGKRPGRGWRSGEAYHCHQAAKTAQARKEYKSCVDDARAALELEQQLGTRLTLAQCLESRNTWSEAIAEYEELSRIAPRKRQYRVGRQAGKRAQTLRRRMPALIIETPDNKKLVVKLDGATLPPDVLNTEFEVDPGTHSITAEDGPLKFEQEVELAASKTVTVLVQLSPGPPKWGTRSELECILAASTQDEITECLGKRSSKAGDLTFRIGAEASGYHDTMAVDVLTPSVSTSVENSLAGWGLGASFLVDVVTAASVDIVATASPQWTEARYVPSINGHKRFDPVDIKLAGTLSHEPDYLSATIGGGLTVDLRQKTITPSIGYSYSHDLNGRADTPFDVFALPIDRHALDLGLGLVLTKATYAAANFTMVFEDGDTSKPYRHIPLFEPITAPAVPAGLAIDTVNLVRLPERPLEQLPTNRKRFGIALQAAHRFADSTLRASERIYFDSWGVAATTTDVRFFYDIIKQLRVWPHLRFHVQSGAEFYELAYVGEQTPDGLIMPQLRTGDRELGPLLAATFGGGVRYDFGTRRTVGLVLTGDVVYSKFLNHLFVKDRYGYFGALGFEAQFE